MNTVKDAWDDDWDGVDVRLDDRGLYIRLTCKQKTPSQPQHAQILSRAERKARHAEANKQLWDAAEQPEQSYFLESKNNIPLNHEFKPQMKVLSRRPQVTPKIARPGDTGLSAVDLSLQDEEDSEEEARRKNAETLAERQRKAAIEREEKQKRYNEARERLLGPIEGASKGSAGGSTSKSPIGSRPSSSSRRGRGQGVRGGGGGGGGGAGVGSGSQAALSVEHSPAGPTTRPQLFDPNEGTKPRDVRTKSRQDIEPVRQPRGPEEGGKGGFKFGTR